MKRGEIWWVSFNQSAGGEIRKERPAVIVSNNAANKHLNRVQVVPLSTSRGKLYPSESYVNVQTVRSKAMTDQVTTASKYRLTKKIGAVSQAEIKGIERAIRRQLDL